MISINNKSELLFNLNDSNQRVITWFTEIPPTEFFIRQGEVWSASDNLDHIIKSQKPTAKAMRIPKPTLREMFGLPEQPSRSYDTICQIYRDALARGGVASGRYLPEQQNPDHADEVKSELLNQFGKASTDLVSVAENWSEAELDEYLLPHPLLGKLTIREMLYFTMYHNLRHASQTGD